LEALVALADEFIEELLLVVFGKIAGIRQWLNSWRVFLLGNLMVDLGAREVEYEL
jgi:hypothetical protein